MASSRKSLGDDLTYGVEGNKVNWTSKNIIENENSTIYIYNIRIYIYIYIYIFVWEALRLHLPCMFTGKPLHPFFILWCPFSMVSCWWMLSQVAFFLETSTLFFPYLPVLRSPTKKKQYTRISPTCLRKTPAWLTALYVAGMLITGSINTLSTKLQFQLHSLGKDHAGVSVKLLVKHGNE